MGSSNSGRFTDYPGSGRAKGGDGGGVPGDRCQQAFSVQLEDVEHSAYYAAHGKPPGVGTVLQIAQEKRIVAKTDDEAVGNLPTRFNYLAACLKAGHTYVGTVTTSQAGATILVSADFAPSS